MGEKPELSELDSTGVEEVRFFKDWSGKVPQDFKGEIIDHLCFPLDFIHRKNK